MENAKKTEQGPTSNPEINKVINQLTKDNEATTGLWKQAMSFVGFAAGLVGGYFFFGVSKEKEIKLLQEQIDSLKRENKLLSSKLKKRNDKALDKPSTTCHPSPSYFLD